MGGRRSRDADAGLPIGLRTAWGQPPAARGPRPALSLEAIVRAGVGIAAAEGLEAVAMARVASALGVGTMSLYRHVGGKEELLALMADAVFAEPPAPVAAGEGWRGALGRWATDYLAVLRRHPWAVRVPIAGPPITPNHVRWFDRGLGCLAATALSEAEKLHVLMLVNGFVRHEALLAADLAAAGAGADDRTASAAYGRRLGALVDAQRFPALTRLLASDVFTAPDSAESAFQFGLARILDGIESLIGSAPRRRR